MGARVIFCNRFFWPDESATAQILSDVAFDLAARGQPVTVVTSQLSYSDPKRHLAAREEVAGVQILRVRTWGGGRQALLAKAAHFVTFYMAASTAAWREVRRGDVLVAKTDPPLLSIPMMLVARMRGAKFVVWIQDLYPELAGRLGVAIARGLTGRFLAMLRNKSLKAASANVVIGKRMLSILCSQGVREDQIVMIPNWTADRALLPNASGHQSLRKEWGFASSDTIVGYSGNLGRAHDVDTILHAAKELQLSGRSDIHFLFVGGGKTREYLYQRASTLGLGNIAYRPYVERSRLGESMAVADIHWLSLKPDLEGMIVPSKFYGIAASARPAIFVGSPTGEIAELLEKHGAGLTCPVGNSALLAQQIVQLADDPEFRTRLGRNGRRAIDESLNQRVSTSAWASLINRLVSQMDTRKNLWRDSA
ncbi:glycosyltransferase family 4 protein [Stakelama saccharophila]|uniref:Glycosyltransferase family 4 protein n=1 Tax=Stakelama saccharophila TaxID=3075605 RepID=A0ABZ0BD29_9SPHN|nr:glycosyltransferase family 4 protein [Stakelama sp. W311]WNO55218.1 glycosyltransferase family 4 protein [Stakelama sp. W311]